MSSTARRSSLIARAQEYMDRGETRRATAREIGVAESTLRSWLPEWRMPPDGPEPEENNTDFTGGTVSAQGRTIEEVLRAHDVDPDQVVVTSSRITDGGPNPEQSWVRVNFRFKESLIQLPDLSAYERLPIPDNFETDDDHFSHGTVAFLADQHLPFINKPAESAALSYLRAEQPSLIVNLGDLGNHGHLSRHRDHPRFIVDANATNDAVAAHLFRQREVCPDAEIIMLPGNHDARILYYLQDYAERLHALRPGRLPGEDEDPEDAITLRKLYRLDELGIRLIDEDWKLASYPIVAELSARHGYLTGTNAERKLLETHGRSQVHGHLHRGEIVYRTKHDPLDVRVAMSVPTLAAVKSDGLGYQPDPDWTPGIGVAHVWDDGTFVVSIAPFINEQLLLPDGRRFSGIEEG